MFSQIAIRGLTTGIAVVLAASSAAAHHSFAPHFDANKKVNISGTVKIEVTVAPNGTVKEARVVGGHPVLANLALDAAKKWRFEAAAAESTGVIEFKFEPR